MQVNLSDIETLFDVIKQLPGTNYSEYYFKERLSTAKRLVESERDIQDAMAACNVQPQELLQLPKVVRNAKGILGCLSFTWPLIPAADMVLCGVASRLEVLDVSKLPLDVLDEFDDDDDDNEAG